MKFIAAIGLLLLGIFTCVGTARSAESAEIVFESGGRVMSIEADSSDRRNLTPWKLPGYLSGTEATPVISPDGERMAYIEEVQPDSGRYFARVIVADREGKNRKVVLGPKPASRRIDYLAVSWGPSGRLFTSEYLGPDRKHRFTLTRIASMDMDGSNRNIEVSRVYRGRGRGHSFILDVDVSPDGRRLLVGSFSGGLIPKLEVLNRASGSLRTLRWRADSGSWSPDGSRILFESDRTGIRESCFRGRCFGDTKLFIARSDGTKARRVTRGLAPGNESDGSWSPDGTRIAFASDRNNRNLYLDEGREIYTVKPDGSCLAWITNGTPGSFNPSWGPETGLSTAPATCGPSELPPTVDLIPDADPLVNGEPIDWPRLWLGPVYAGRAQTLIPDDGRELAYEDCVLYRPSYCSRLTVQVSSDDVCLNWVEQLAGYGMFGRVIMWRGALTFLPDEAEQEAVVLTGGQAVMITLERTDDRGGTESSMWLRAIRKLRPVGAEEATGDLEEPVIDRKLPARARYYAKAVEEAGSISKAAKRLRDRPSTVRNWIKIDRALEQYGPFRTVSCRGWL